MWTLHPNSLANRQTVNLHVRAVPGDLVPGTGPGTGLDLFPNLFPTCSRILHFRT